MTASSFATLELLKNIVAAIVLPPGPLLPLALGGAWVARRRRGLGVGLTAIACLGIWLCACDGAGRGMERAWIPVPPPLGPADRARLAADVAHGTPVAIVVLGGGLTEVAPEYGVPVPQPAALERLRYGAWLARATGAALAISGGIGWASPQTGPDGMPVLAEADVMADIATRELGCPVRWRESASHDTRENARRTVALLGPQGVHELVVVTSDWHMPRALRAFRAAVAASAPGMQIVAAPMGFALPAAAPALAWVPSASGLQRVRSVLREVLALHLGA